jgi:hypothetical protein
MVPRISVRRQNRFGIAVAIERFRGRQYRCLVCGTVFYELDELDAHVRRDEAPGSDSPDLPRFDEPLLIRIFYSKDIREGWDERLKKRR